MKKTLLGVVLVCMTVVFLTAYSPNPSRGKLGYLAPNFYVENESKDLELQQLKGRYVLLSFWKSTDAESRIANLQYDRAVRNLSGIDYVAVNFDTSYGVYQEILKNDGLDVTTQFYDRDGRESKLYSRYDLGQGMKTILLDKSGRIVAKNPSPQELNRFGNVAKNSW